MSVLQKLSSRQEVKRSFNAQNVVKRLISKLEISRVHLCKLTFRRIYTTDFELPRDDVDSRDESWLEILCHKAGGRSHSAGHIEKITVPPYEKLSQRLYQVDLRQLYAVFDSLPISYVQKTQLVLQAIPLEHEVIIHFPYQFTLRIHH